MEYFYKVMYTLKQATEGYSQNCQTSAENATKKNASFKCEDVNDRLQ
jgi:hypothetical protein